MSFLLMSPPPPHALPVSSEHRCSCSSNFLLDTSSQKQLDARKTSSEDLPKWDDEHRHYFHLSETTAAIGFHDQCMSLLGWLFQRLSS
jgi:hypothetical protein